MIKNYGSKATIKAKITFHDPDGEKTEIVGREVMFRILQLGDVTDRMAETEEHLARIMGLVVRIETGIE